MIHVLDVKTFELTWVVQKVNHYPVGAVCFVNTHPLNSDLSGRYCYSPFEQLGSACERHTGSHYIEYKKRGKSQEYKVHVVISFLLRKRVVPISS